jgi:hypothetical protein
VLGRQAMALRAGAGVRRAGGSIEGRRWAVVAHFGKLRSQGSGVL